MELTNKVDSLTPLPGKIDKIINDVESINRNLTSLEPRVSEHESRIFALEDAVKNMPLSSTEKLSERMIVEINDWVRCASNIIVYGLPQSLKPDVNGKKTEDLQQLTKLLKSSLPDFDNTGVKTYRIGKKQTDKPRAL